MPQKIIEKLDVGVGQLKFLDLGPDHSEMVSHLAVILILYHKGLSWVSQMRDWNRSTTYRSWLEYDSISNAQTIMALFPALIFSGLYTQANVR